VFKVATVAKLLYSKDYTGLRWAKIFVMNQTVSRFKKLKSYAKLKILLLLHFLAYPDPTLQFDNDPDPTRCSVHKPSHVIVLISMKK
jgi:hypothetical protein